MKTGVPRKVAEFMAANPPPPCAVWPENWDPYRVFAELDTQWRHGFAGRTGLDYAVVPRTMKRLGVRKKQREDVWQAIRVMESAALDFFDEKRQQKRPAKS